MRELTRSEAADRARLLRIHGYEVEIDLTSGEATFRSTSTIRFSCAEPGATSFLDLTATDRRAVTLNGRPIDPGTPATRRVELRDLQAENVVVVDAAFAYSATGEGLHRFVDPADGETYLWTQHFLFNANRVFGCFDQPDLKAPLRLRVRAPDHWTVLSNGAGTRGDDGTWAFAETPPLATYTMVLVAGPFHSVYADGDGIPLGLHCRRSLAHALDADELFDLTRASFRYYAQIFDTPYAFGKYDQAFVPEFQGAMEEAGCVKFADDFLFRSRVTDRERLDRAETIAHELAHMWFGDLVTLRWWDDLWLNESFAEYISTLAVVEATRFTSAWTTFVTFKGWGYRQDELPTTHPIVADAPDTEQALLNIDGIAYAKGAGVLRQLVAWVGRDAFLEGLRDYIRRNAYGNTTLRDLLDALEGPSGRDLRAWSRAWLETAGVTTIRLEGADVGMGVYGDVSVRQTAPHEHPTLRPHRIAIGLYDDDGTELRLRDRVELDVDGALTPVPHLAGVRGADVLLPNDGDLTWAKIRLDARSLRTLRDGGLARLKDPVARALAWAAAWDMLRDAELPVADYLALVAGAIVSEDDITVVEHTLARATRAAQQYGSPSLRPARLHALADLATGLLAAAEPGSDRQLAAARAFLAVATSPDDAARVQDWLAGRSIPDGVVVDQELRWLAVRTLAASGVIGEDEIATELARDPTSIGAEGAAAARAGRPHAAAKEQAWAEILSGAHPIAVERSAVRAFWQAGQEDLCRPYVERYFAALPSIWAERGPESAAGLTEGLYPLAMVEDATLERTDAALAADPAPPLRRLLLEGRHDLERTMRTRAADSAAGAELRR